MNIEPLIATFQEVPKAAEQALLRVALANHAQTPSRGLIAATTRYLHEHQKSLDVWISATPHASEWNDTEIKLMEDDLFQCQELGVDGVIFGATTKTQHLDDEALEILLGASAGMDPFFSPAFTNLPAAEWPHALQWLSDHQFRGIVATDHLTELQTALKAYPTLQLVPMTANLQSAQRVESELHVPTIISPLAD
ncbi:copper resistance protein [Fructilactobacillus hinvesii]|uniref:Copper resistance protein n=1 Tax=Fructilactobacillus hinvesii TaxID=2940300 RepID=A0ABY5BRH2_9LACO|nr:copper homeostasis protein CutC [Fructilactobacillus hinvesii]USS87245.1 copper resistance protein [Fructilactobacillus hinvesii]